MDSAYGTGAKLCLSPVAGELEERDFLRLADASAGMLWMATLDGRRTFSNKAWLEFRRRTPEQELGSGWAEGIHPDDREWFGREHTARIAARQPFRLDFRILAGDGGYHRIEESAHLWFEAGGRLGGYVGSTAVVTRDEENTREAARELGMLSKRERQILELIARGDATKEAANKLGISYKTADSHRSHVLKKLGLHETASLVRFAVRSGLIQA